METEKSREETVAQIEKTAALFNELFGKKIRLKKRACIGSFFFLHFTLHPCQAR